MDTHTEQKIINANGIFNKSFLDAKAFFLYTYQRPPSIAWVEQADNEKILAYVKKEYGDAIRGIYQYSKYDRKKKAPDFYRTIILLKDNAMLELAYEYCEILHLHEDYAMAHSLLRELSRFKKKEKKSNFAIYLIARNSDGMELKSMEIKKTRLDLGLYYAEGFVEMDQLIRKRLNKKEDKGIILLHGLPGAGKTTYLRHLVGTIRKKVLFLPPAVARNIMDPEFMDLLIENPDSVLVIEDAENILMDRKIDGGSSVSNLLNISDGLLADFLHVQVICTFNHPLSMVDAALLRKGRLIAQYEFGRLSMQRAQRLSDHMGFKARINRPMTIAEIAGQEEKDFEAGQRIQVVGFRRAAEKVAELEG